MNKRIHTNQNIYNPTVHSKFTQNDVTEIKTIIREFKSIYNSEIQQIENLEFMATQKDNWLNETEKEAMLKEVKYRKTSIKIIQNVINRHTKTMEHIVLQLQKY